MKRSLSRSLVLVTTLTLTALSLTQCGGKSDSASSALETLGGTRFVNKGSGNYTAESALASADSAANFKLTAKLETGAKLTLVSHATEALASGVELAFTRTAETTVAVTKNGTHIGELTCAADGALVAMIEIHNDESPAHVLVWNNHNSAEEPAFEDDAEAGKGAGDKWGVRLDRVQLSQISVGGPEHSHEE